MTLLQMICLVLSLHILNTKAELCTSDICEYTFVIRRWRTMTYQSQEGGTFQVVLNGTTLQTVENSYHRRENNPSIGSFVNASDVITADGYQRDVITINDIFPGPTIEVMKGKQVVVHVRNELILEATTIHWHGLHMTETAWMDGAAYVTQCPILPNQVFTYRFQADPAGTHWYHSHIHGQRLDGLFGLIIVYERQPTLPEFGITLNDWIHDDIIALDVQHPYNKYKSGSGYMVLDLFSRDYSVDGNEVTSLKFYSALINGRGRFNESTYPLTEFLVTEGRRYRFRMVNTGAEYSFNINIDGHILDIVASDGNEMIPIRVDSFMLHPGESVDFEMEANQDGDKYWMRADTLEEGALPSTDVDGLNKGGKAILRYAGITNSGDPTTSARQCSEQNPCKIFNCPFMFPASFGKLCIPLSDAHSTLNQQHLDITYGLTEAEPDVKEYFLNFAFPIGSSINARKHMEPRAPLFQEDWKHHIMECDRDMCDNTGCQCTHVQTLPYNKTIQLVLMSYTPGPNAMAHHSVHLHGHSFAVMAMGLGKQNDSTGFWTGENQDILCSGDNPYLCTRPRWNGIQPSLNKVTPPVKDTVIIPARGYVVVRFRSLNPGFWMLHCHQELHMIEGMSMIFDEAPDDHKPVPNNFPVCSDFTWTADEYKDYLYSSKSRATPVSTKTSSPISTTPIADDKDNNKVDDVWRQDVVILDTKTAIGVSFGFILLGAFIAIIMAIIQACCNKRRELEYKL